MNYGSGFCCVLLFIMNSAIGQAASIIDENNYWQCTTNDAANKQWISKSNYKKIALNRSFSDCKKFSQSPMTCTVAQSTCEQFIQGVSIQPMWRCTALDRQAQIWRSALYSQRYDAALAAKAYCRQRSLVPETCYINLVTCTERNG